MKEITVEDCIKLKEDFDNYTKTAEQYEFAHLAMIQLKLDVDIEIKNEGVKDQKDTRAMFRVVLRAIGKDFSEYEEHLYENVGGIKMVGYKVYFDGKKFVAEDKLSEVENDSRCPDLPVMWFSMYLGYDYAEKMAANLNEKYKNSVEELEKYSHFIIKKCKDCNRHFILVKRKIDWFKEKNLSIPVRCSCCIQKRKKNKEDGVK